MGVKLGFSPPSALSDRLSSGFVLANHIFINVDKILREKETLPFYHPVDLYLISEKSIWKNQVRRTGFLVYFKLDFYWLCSLQKSILKLIFGGQRSSRRTWFLQLDFSSTDQQGECLLTNNNRQLIADLYTFVAKIKNTTEKDCLSIRNIYNDFQIDNVFIYDNWQYSSNEVTNFDRTTDFYQV